jgi:serine/threonine protein kinase
MDTDHNLLFGVLALQADLIDAGQFAEACTAWTARKGTPLAEVLLERGWISAADKGDIDRLLERKLKRHGSIRASLAAAADDSVLRVLAVLNDPDIESSLGAATGADNQQMPPTVAPAPQEQGRYQLTRLHAQGGIGQVWLAHDHELGRDVALKELRPDGNGHAGVVLRFVEEAKITGQLQHPGIVPVYDLGRRPDTQEPFYTMRFVQGRTLADAIDDYHRLRAGGKAGPLELQALLNAFVGVCNAVAYAHSRGVLHRDLKPQNVVLGDFGEVMVLDWGLGKLVGRPGEDTITPQVVLEQADGRGATLQGQVLGTPAYMAPEQAAGRVDLFERRTDVWGLGAILYALLTGRPPFSGANTREVLHKVQHEEPARPRDIVPEVPPALEAVCLAALCKRREGRYGTAAELGQEVRRWLADEPVAACPEPLPARLGRWSRRHRALVASAAVLLVSAVAGLSAGVVLLGRANTRTEQQRALAQQNLEKAQEQEEKATAAAQRAEAVNNFLVNDLLAEAAPERNAWQKKVTLEEVLDRAADKVGKGLAEQPLAEASVRLTLASTYWKLGRPAKGEPHARRALELYSHHRGPEDPDTLRAVNELALLLQDQGKLSDAEPLWRQNLQMRQRVQGPEHHDTLGAVNNLANLLQAQGKLAAAEPLLRQNLEAFQRVRGPDHPDTLNAVNSLAYLLQQQGKLAEAEPLFRQNVEARRRVHGPDHPRTLTAVNNLATLLTQRGKLSEAEPLFRQNLEARRRVQGPDHHETRGAVNNLAALLRQQGKLSEAESLLRQNLKAFEKARGHDHLETLTARNNVVVILQSQGKLSEAEPLARQNLEALRRIRGAEHSETLIAVNNLAFLLQQQWKFPEAESLLRPNVEALRRVLGPDHPNTLTAVDNLVTLLQFQGKLSEAEPLVRQNLEARRRVLGPDHPDTLQAASSLATLLTFQGKLAEAEALWRQNLEARRRVQGPEHLDTLQAMANLAIQLQQQGKLSEAEPLARQALAGRRKALPAAHPDVADSLTVLASVLTERGKGAEAEPLLRECLALRQKALPRGDVRVAGVQSLLGSCLAAQKKYAEAEPLLLQGYETMARAKGVPPKLLDKARQRLVQLYEAWGKPDKAAAWKAKAAGPK